MADANIHDHGTATTRRRPPWQERGIRPSATLRAAIDDYFGRVSER